MTTIPDDTFQKQAVSTKFPKFNKQLNMTLPPLRLSEDFRTCVKLAEQMDESLPNMLQRKHFFEQVINITVHTSAFYKELFRNKLLKPG